MLSKKKIEEHLLSLQHDLDERTQQLETDEEIQNDTEWCNDYNNLTGWIEALEFVLEKEEDDDEI